MDEDETQLIFCWVKFTIPNLSKIKNKLDKSKAQVFEMIDNTATYAPPQYMMR